MPTNREIYFKLLKENNKYLNKSVIVSLLTDANEFSDRMMLYSNFDKEVKNIEKFLNDVSVVKKGIPYQYVLGYSEFLGHKINVNQNVLIPRQETEQLTVDTIVYLKRFMDQNTDCVIADVCIVLDYDSLTILVGLDCHHDFVTRSQRDTINRDGQFDAPIALRHLESLLVNYPHKSTSLCVL